MMTELYDNRMSSARPNTAFALDEIDWTVHAVEMRTSREILDELKARGITQGEIAEVLRVKQPNVATLYNPGKNGKPRRLGYDEAIALIDKFGLDADEAGEPKPPSAENLKQLLNVLLPLAPKGHVSEPSLRALSEALAHGIELLGSYASTPASQDAIEVAARGALFRFREIGSA